MIRATAIKELRETAGIAVIGLLLYGALVGSKLLAAVAVQGNNQHFVPFVSDGFVGSFQAISLGLAIALGFRQSAWEGMRGTYLFLLHRPAPHQQIFVHKIITGLVLLMLVAAMPLLAYAAWAEPAGNPPDAVRVEYDDRKLVYLDSVAGRLSGRVSVWRAAGAMARHTAVAAVGRAGNDDCVERTGVVGSRGGKRGPMRGLAERCALRGGRARFWLMAWRASPVASTDSARLARTKKGQRR